MNCAWCGAGLTDDAEWLAGRVRCPFCGVATTYPWPTDEQLERAYAGWYRPASGRFSGPGDTLLRRSRAALVKRVEAVAPPGRVLDVGAGDGALVEAFRSAGRDALGVERQAAGPHVVDTPLSELEGEFAAVVFWHSLEHLPDPGGALRAAARLLAPGGVLVVAIPNAASLQARVFGDRWLALDLPRHLVHIPARALEQRLRSLGLSVGRVSHIRGGQVVFGWAHGLVGLLPGRPSLYDAIRRPEARERALTPARRAGVVAAGAVAMPLAAAATAAEVGLRRGGTVYVEARRG